VVKLVNGGLLMEVMPRRDVDAIRDTYGPRTKQGKLVGPWVTNYEPMGRKTVLIQTLKLAPKESERLQYALAAENDALFGSRVASAVVDVPTSAADRVAKKLGADEDAADVVDSTATEDSADDQYGFDSEPGGAE
jgi:recombinational DNA repair protein RecT